MRIATLPNDRRFITAACGVALVAFPLAAAPTAAQSILSNLNCSVAPTGHVAWPATNPVWEFDFVRPSARTTTRGAGLELRDVRYNGRVVIERAHAPILNVEYDPGGGCSCFRDWSYTEAGIATGPVLPGGNACVALAEAGNVVTTCESNQPPDPPGPGGDPGSFLGVGVEDFGTELVLTGNMSAGWYRYRMKWHFYLDGRIWPEYSFSAADAVCTATTHRHHAYWRFDFDIDDTPVNDIVTEVNPFAGTSVTFTEEVARESGPSRDGIFWQIRDGSTSVGYDLVPSTADRLLPVDGFSKFDLAVLQYHAGVYDDGVNSLNDCAIRPERMVGTSPTNPTPESLVGQDVEVWYRSGALHPGNNPWECDIVGPSLIPEGLATAGEPDAPPSGLLIEGARPNPFNPTTSIRFRLAEQQHVTVRLFDVTGRQVAVLFDGWARENREEIVRIDGSTLPGGTYVVRLEGETVEGSTRVVLLK
jgi:hypothetical protein